MKAKKKTPFARLQTSTMYIKSWSPSAENNPTKFPNSVFKQANILNFTLISTELWKDLSFIEEMKYFPLQES